MFIMFPSIQITESCHFQPSLYYTCTHSLPLLSLSLSLSLLCRAFETIKSAGVPAHMKTLSNMPHTATPTVLQYVKDILLKLFPPPSTPTHTPTSTPTPTPKEESKK